MANLAHKQHIHPQQSFGPSRFGAHIYRFDGEMFGTQDTFYVTTHRNYYTPHLLRDVRKEIHLPLSKLRVTIHYLDYESPNFDGNPLERYGSGSPRRLA